MSLCADTDAIFALSAEDAVRKALAPWNVVSNTRPILLGAGQKGRETLAVLRQAGVTPLCFADDTPAKQGTACDGLGILSLEQALKQAGPQPAVIVCLFTPHHQFKKTAARVQAQCPTATIIPFYSAWLACQNEAFENYFLCHPKHEVARFADYRQLYAKLTDDTSREVLCDHLRLRLLHDTSLDFSPRTQMPLPKAILENPALSYVDGGAFDGDTVEEFVNLTHAKFRHIFAMEPDSGNRKKMESRLSHLAPAIREKISLCPQGIWHSSGTIGFASDGNMGSQISIAGENKIAVTSLDDLLATSAAPIFIKLDVEGVEMEALAGAQKITQKARPVWAISVYHKPGDLAEVYRWLENSQQSYNYALRCHGGDGSDLMLYAW